MSGLTEPMEQMDNPTLQQAPYEGLTDEEIILRCHEGDDRAMDYMLTKYKNFVRSKARSYFLVGADHEDIVQEGMIGLYKAQTKHPFQSPPAPSVRLLVVSFSMRRLTRLPFWMSMAGPLGLVRVSPLRVTLHL